jgi:hypothetical protein
VKDLLVDRSGLKDDHFYDKQRLTWRSGARLVAGMVRVNRDIAVREATYGYRERERHRRVEHDAQNGTAPTLPYRRT